MASKKDNKRLTAKTLIDKGKKQGSLTLSEIMEAFSETELDKDQVENLYETLGNLGIEIIEDKNEIFSVKALLCEYDSNNFYRNQVAKYKVTGNTDTTQTKSML